VRRGEKGIATRWIEEQRSLEGRGGAKLEGVQGGKNVNYNGVGVTREKNALGGAAGRARS